MQGSLVLSRKRKFDQNSLVIQSYFVTRQTWRRSNTCFALLLHFTCCSLRKLSHFSLAFSFYCICPISSNENGDQLHRVRCLAAACWPHDPLLIGCISPTYRKAISLLSHSDVRYRGILAGLDPLNSTIQLRNGERLSWGLVSLLKRRLFADGYVDFGCV